METEIKLSLSAASRPRVEDHPLLAAVQATSSRNVSIYYDTPDFALRGRGVTLRVRSSGGDYIQTVKSSRDGAKGFASRGEWEWPVASDAVDPEALARDKHALKLVSDDLDRLGPVFVTDFTRRSRLLTLDGKTTVEVVLDSGEVRAGDRSNPIDEMELELKGGPAGPLFHFAGELARRADLRIGPEPKSERGYALLTDTPPPASAHPALPEDVTLGDAFPLLIGAACRALAGELSASARGDVEGIHRLRAAIRRLRTLLVLLAPRLDAEAAERFDGLLGDLGRTLGAGRDWDVFLTETLAAAEADLGREELASLRDAAAVRDRDAHAAVTSVLEGPVPTELLLGLASWTADESWLREDADAPERFTELLPDLLDRLERKAMRRGRHLKRLDAEELHGLRKTLKKLRYACEDVAPLFRHKAVDRYVGAVRKVLQDLGRINDAAVTGERVAELATPDRTELAGVAAALLAWTEKRREAGARDLRRRWRKLRHADSFWP